MRKLGGPGSRRRMTRRLFAVVGVGGVAVCLYAAVAWAAPAAIESLPGTTDSSNHYSMASYSHDSGTVATFTWVGGTSHHNVTATGRGPDGQPLFHSATIGSGTTDVNGTQYLPDGTYHFICTIHGPSMSSDLVVSGGTPVARPTVAVAIVSTKLSRVRKQHKLFVSVTSTGAGTPQLRAKFGHKTLGSTSAASGTVPIHLSSSAVKALKGKKKAKVSLSGSIAFGAPSSATKVLK